MRMASSQPSPACDTAKKHGPMSPWNDEALSSLQERLRNNVQLQHGLGDKLERAAGGFMNKGEATVVRDKRLQGNNRQMEEVITILRGKSDEDFEIFCKILQESNNETWADELKKEAEQFKREIAEQGEPSIEGDKEKMPVDVVALTTEELFQYLSVELNEGIATIMKKEKVSGMEFLDLTEEDLNKLLTLGDRMRVMRLIRKHSQPMPKVVSPDSACDEKESSEKQRIMAQLVLAVHRGRLSEVRRIVKQDEEVVQHAEKWKQVLLLHLAVQGGGECLAIIQYLVPKMRDLFQTDSYGQTALHAAARKGQLEVVKYFVNSCGFNVKAKNEEGATPFLIAVAEGHRSIAFFLLDNGNDVFECQNTGYNPLHISAQRGHLALVQHLAPKMDGHLHDQTCEGRTALHFAADSGHLDVTDYLVTVCGLEVDSKAKNGTTPLQRAAFMGHIDVVCFLIENGGNVFHQDDGGCNALHISAQGGHCDMVKYLVPKMKDHLFDTDADGYTALHWAVGKGHLAVVEYLVKSCGFDVKAETLKHHTPLLRAVCMEQFEIAKFLLENGSDVFECNEFQMNAIHLASVEGLLDWVKYLAPLAGDRICDKDLTDRTCLDWAMHFKNQSVVLYLSSSFPVLRSKGQPKSPFLAEMRAQKAYKSNSFYPMTSCKCFPSPGPDYGTKVLAKLTEFNGCLSPPFVLSESEVANLQTICTELSKPPPSALLSNDHCQLLYTMLSWPAPFVFPVLDMVRLALLQPVGTEFFLKGGISCDLLDKFVHFSLDGDQPDNVRVARRCLANMFSSSAGCLLMVNYQQQVFPALDAKGENTNRTAQIALATVILNYCHYFYQKGECDVHVLLKDIAEILQSVTFDAEAKFRTLVAVGTLASTGRDMADQLQTNGFRDIIQPLATQKDSVKLSECANVLLQEL